MRKLLNYILSLKNTNYGYHLKTIFLKGTTYILLFLVIFAYSKTKAQSYHAFPTSNAAWSEENFLYGASTGGSWTNVYTDWLYALGDDTLIESIHYTLVGYQRIFHIQFWNGDFSDSINYDVSLPGEIFGAIREDSTKKVWFRKLPQGTFLGNVCFDPSVLPIDTEILLYDFDLQVGDSITWGPGYYLDIKKIVVSIDSILFNDGTYRKRYKLYYPTGGDEYWIEGMGSTNGLFGAHQIAPDPDWNGGYYCWLNCFWQDGDYLFEKFPVSAYAKCDAIPLTGIQDFSNSQDTSRVLPNPFTTYTTIEFSLNNSSTTSIKIYDVNGRLVKVLFDNITLNTGDHSINVYAAELKGGVYFYHLKTNEKMEIGKMVLIK